MQWKICFKQLSLFKRFGDINYGTYGTVPDVQEDLLSLLRTTDDVGEAGSLLRRHPVMRKAALESSSFQTCGVGGGYAQIYSFDFLTLNVFILI